MESYPTEFTFHTSPLLFIAGLNPAPSPPSVKPNGTSSDSSVALPQPPPAQPTDPFDILTTALRKTFASRKGFQLWDNSRGQNHDFHTLLVDKNLRFPPLKARPTSSSTIPPGQPPVPLHSPISPLTPSSPLYPDGIIAPIWIRKHRELVPSVFILVLRLYESPSTGGAPTDPTEREEEEREKDSLLIREIIDRKRSTLERGIKLAVVLFCSRELLDDPSLDLRLSLIRRQSGLDSRASLFVISPVPQSEVTNFVASIRSELWPAAIDYYREHARRVRRKRARQPPKGGLGERGWNVRYDYKLALFAEMRGEIEVALKHYEDCYESLVDMFSQPKLLVARTKRWAEAKVLADCLTVKVAKLYLYLNDPSRSLSQLNRHVFRFRQLSESWSIGDETFEFWSWLSKQYRLFGDLTTAALRAGFRLPSLRPPPMPIPTPGVPQPPSPGLMPINVLQHPGHYYFLAAICALERRERYRSIKAALDNGSSEKPPEGALLHEGKVDHTEVIIELYTKAYEHFKHHGRRRTTYYLASLIALAHASSSPPNIDMALKFWDRIGRNYRKDGWAEIIEGMEEAVFECAKQGEKWVEAIKAGWNLLSPESNVSVDQRAQFAQELLAILKTHPPRSPEEATVQLDSDLSPILIFRLVFLQPKGIISTQIPFQLAISSPAKSRLSDFTFDTLELHFNDNRPPITVRHSADAVSSPESVARYEVGKGLEESLANLTWNDGTTKVFSGTVSSDKSIELTIEKLVLKMSLGEWNLAATLRLDRRGSNIWYLDGQRTVSLNGGSSSVCSISPRSLKLAVKVNHTVPAYLGERYPIVLEITNEDDLDVEIAFVGFVQPGEEGSQSRLSIDENSSTSLLDSIPLGNLPSKQTLRKTVLLECFGSSGNRHLDLTVRSSPSSTVVDDAAKPTSTESTHSLVVPCYSPFLDRFESRYYSKRRRIDSLLDLQTEPSEWAGAREGIMSGQIKIRGPWPVEITGIRVEQEESLDVRIVVSSLDEVKADLPISLNPGDVFGASFNFEVKPLLPGQTHPSRMPSVSISWKRMDTSHEPTTTLLPFPHVQRYPLLPLITLRLPSHMTLNTPATLHYTLSNPTSRLLHLATQIDSAIQPSSFVFAGPRKIASLVLAPGEETSISVRIVPLMIGDCEIPRFRVFEVEQVSTIQQLDQEGQPIPPPPPRMRELDVEVETQPSREVRERDNGELDLGRVGQEDTDSHSRVLVLPDTGDLE